MPIVGDTINRSSFIQSQILSRLDFLQDSSKEIEVKRIINTLRVNAPAPDDYFVQFVEPSSVMATIISAIPPSQLSYIIVTTNLIAIPSTIPALVKVIFLLRATRGTNFTSLILSDSTTQISMTDFINMDCVLANFTSAKLKGISFQSALLNGANFTSALLNSAIFKRCNLTDAVLDHADATGADFKYAIFYNTSLHNAKMLTVNLANASMLNVTMDLADFTGATGKTNIELLASAKRLITEYTFTGVGGETITVPALT